MDESSSDQYNSTWTTNFKQAGFVDVNGTAVPNEASYGVQEIPRDWADAGKT